MSLHTVLVAVATMPIGWWCAGFAARRNSAQPVDADGRVEQELCTLVEADPALWLALNGELRVGDFCTPAAALRWEQIEERVRATKIAQLALSAEEITGRTKTVEALLHERVLAGRELAGAGAGEVRQCTRAAVKLAEKVVGNALSREQVTKRSRLVPNLEDPSGVRPLVREASHASIQRRVVCSVITGALGWFASLLAPELGRGAAGMAFFVTMLLLGVGGLLIALVDLDTYYLDTPVFWTWAGVCWVAVSGSCAAAGRAGDALVGVLATLCVAAGFEAVAFVWSRLRGITQGFGDTLIALCTVGVPVAMTGMFLVGIWSVLAASLLALTAWGIGFARGTTTAATPLAYGPYLAAGWPVALAVWAVVS